MLPQELVKFVLWSCHDECNFNLSSIMCSFLNACSVKWQYLCDFMHVIWKYWGLVIWDWYFEGRVYGKYISIDVGTNTSGVGQHLATTNQPKWPAWIGEKEGVEEQFPEVDGNSHYEKLWNALDRRELHGFGSTIFITSPFSYKVSPKTVSFSLVISFIHCDVIYPGLRNDQIFGIK